MTRISIKPYDRKEYIVAGKMITWMGRRNPHVGRQVPVVTKDTVVIILIKPYDRIEYIVAVQVSYDSQMPI